MKNLFNMQWSCLFVCWMLFCPYTPSKSIFHCFYFHRQRVSFLQIISVFSSFHQVALIMNFYSVSFYLNSTEFKVIYRILLGPGCFCSVHLHVLSGSLAGVGIDWLQKIARSCEDRSEICISFLFKLINGNLCYFFF